MNALNNVLLLKIVTQTKMPYKPCPFIMADHNATLHVYVIVLIAI